MRWMLYTGIGSVFVLGGAAGAMLGMTLERERLKKMENGPPAMLMEGVSRRLEHELNLDPDQTQKVRAIYAESRPEVQAVENERRQRMQAIMQTAHAQVETVLRPEQMQAFEDLQRRVEKRLRMRDGWDGPRNGGGGKGRGGGHRQGTPGGHEDSGPRVSGESPGSPPEGRRGKEGNFREPGKTRFRAETPDAESKKAAKSGGDAEKPPAAPEIDGRTGGL